MNRHSLDCFAIDTCVNVNENNNPNTDSYQDNNPNNNNIENNEINECVICFEPVTIVSKISKFGCVHAKFMHEDCVKSLRKCPLCRERSIIVESSRRIDTCSWEQNVICFLLVLGFVTLLFTAAYPMIFFKFDNYNPKINNSTIINTTLFRNI